MSITVRGYALTKLRVLPEGQTVTGARHSCDDQAPEGRRVVVKKLEGEALVVAYERGWLDFGQGRDLRMRHPNELSYRPT